MNLGWRCVLLPFLTFQLQKYSVSLKFDQFDPFSQMTWDVWLMPVNANLWRLNLWTNSNNLSSVRSLMQSILKILFFFVGSAGRLGQIFWKAKMQILILLCSWGWAVTFLGDVLPVMKRCLCVDILTNWPNHSIRSDAWYWKSNVQSRGWRRELQWRFKFWHIVSPIQHSRFNPLHYDLIL